MGLPPEILLEYFLKDIRNKALFYLSTFKNKTKQNKKKTLRPLRFRALGSKGLDYLHQKKT